MIDSKTGLGDKRLLIKVAYSFEIY